MYVHFQLSVSDLNDGICEKRNQKEKKMIEYK